MQMKINFWKLTQDFLLFVKSCSKHLVGHKHYLKPNYETIKKNMTSIDTRQSNTWPKSKEHVNSLPMFTLMYLLLVLVLTGRLHFFIWATLSYPVLLLFISLFNVHVHRHSVNSGLPVNHLIFFFISNLFFYVFLCIICFSFWGYFISFLPWSLSMQFRILLAFCAALLYECKCAFAEL